MREVPMRTSLMVLAAIASGCGEASGQQGGGDCDQAVVELQEDLEGRNCVDPDLNIDEACCPRGFTAVGSNGQAIVCLEDC